MRLGCGGLSVSEQGMDGEKEGDEAVREAEGSL